MEFKNLITDATNLEPKDLDCFAATCLFQSLMDDLVNAAKNKPISQLPFDEEQTGDLLSNLVYIMNIGRDIYNAKKDQMSNIPNTIRNMIDRAFASKREIEALGEEIGEQLAALKNARSDLDKAQKEYAEKQKQLKEAQAAQAECDRLTEEIEKVKQEFEKYKDADPEALRRELEKLREDYEKLEGENGRLTRQCEEAQKKLDNAAAENKRLTDVLDNTKKHIGNLEHDIKETKKEIGVNNRKIGKLLEEKAELTEKWETVYNMLDSLNNEVSGLRDRVNKANAEYNKLLDEQDELREREIWLISETKKIEDEIETINKEIPEKENEKSEKEKERSGLDERYKELKTQIASMKERNDKLEKDVIKKLESSHNEECGRQEHLGGELIALLEKCGIAMREEITDLESKILTEAGNFTTLNAMLEQKNDEYNKCVKQNEIITGNIAELNKRIEELKNAASEERCGVIEDQLKKEIERLETLIRREEELKTENENKQKEIDTINSLIEKAEAEKEKLAKQLDELAPISAEDKRNQIGLYSDRLALLEESRVKILETVAALEDLLLPKGSKDQKDYLKNIGVIIGNLAKKIDHLKEQLDRAALHCEDALKILKENEAR